MRRHLKEVSVGDMFSSVMGGQDPNGVDYNTHGVSAADIDIHWVEKGKGVRKSDLHPAMCPIAEAGLSQGSATAAARWDGRTEGQLDSQPIPLVIRYTERSNDGGEMKDPLPDYTIYADNDRTRRLLTDPSDESAMPIKDTQKLAARHSWADTVSLIEVKAKRARSAFMFHQPGHKTKRKLFWDQSDTVDEPGYGDWEEVSDSDEDEEDDEEDGYDNEGSEGYDYEEYSDEEFDGGQDPLVQLKEHVTNTFAYQHRTHLYVLYICLYEARICFFDRSGGLISKPFPYGKGDDRILHRFFYRLATMTREEQGFDSTAVTANESEVTELRKWASGLGSSYLRRMANEALCSEQENEWPTYKISFQGNQTLYVTKPTIPAPSLFSCSVRGYSAIHKKVNDEGNVEYRVCFMKDSWRNIEAPFTEEAMYDRLAKNKVTHVLTCIGGEDVCTDGRQQCTLASHHSTGLLSLCHHRSLFKGVCYPLSTFRHFCDLAKIIADAMEGHASAWNDAGILHGNVNDHTILIHVEEGADGVEKRSGVIADWEMCQFVENMGCFPLGDKRNWTFRSALSQMCPRRPYSVSDDIESFLHVYQYCVLRFHATDHAGHRMVSLVLTTYQDAFGQDENTIGGVTKFNHLKSAFPVLPLNNPSLQILLRELSTIAAKQFSPIWNVLSEYTTFYGECILTMDDPPPPEPVPHPFPTHAELLAFFRKWADERGWAEDCLKRSSTDLFEVAGVVVCDN